jgi:hypothetical protein
MRILILAGALALAACGGKQAADNSAVSESSDSSGVTAVNDTTAIDAATGQAANMAADVNYTIDENELNTAGNNSDNRSATEPDEPGTPGNSTR